MKITYRADGDRVVLEKIVERERMPVKGDETLVCHMYPHLFMTVGGIIDSLVDEEEIRVCTKFCISLPDPIIDYLVEGGWKILIDYRKKK